jgi:SAM-dependent methyltransferase
MGFLSKNVDDELFALSYELKAISSIVNKNMLERWVPGFSKPHTEKEHNSRYKWVAQFTKDTNVMDIACGSGGGSYIIASQGGAAAVKACDVDDQAVKYASIRYGHPHINFVQQNGEEMTLSDQFDIIISFETIEHMHHPEKFVQCVKKRMHSKSIFYVSTPVAQLPHKKIPDNIYHVHEWGFSEFHTFLSPHFHIDEIYLQGSLGIHRNSLLFRTGRLLHREKTITELPDMNPFLWDRKRFTLNQVEANWCGYQIVKCSST